MCQIIKKNEIKQSEIQWTMTKNAPASTCKLLFSSALSAITCIRWYIQLNASTSTFTAPLFLPLSLFLCAEKLAPLASKWRSTTLHLTPEHSLIRFHSPRSILEVKNKHEHCLTAHTHQLQATAPYRTMSKVDDSIAHTRKCKLWSN